MPDRKKPDTIIEPAGKAQGLRRQAACLLGAALLAACAAGPRPQRAAERPPAEAGAASAQLQRARAQVEARQGQAALAELSTLPAPERLAPADRRAFHELRAQALDLAGDWQGAAAERLGLLREAQGDDAPDARDQLWRVLRRQRAENLRAARAQSADPELSGWLELAALTATFAIDPARLKAEVEAWRTANAGHPAATALPEELAGARSEALPPYAPKRIALLLPLSGPLAATAGLIRDGFLAAHYHRGADPAVSIRLYDTGSQDPLAAYSQARNEGAEFVVGPLEKEAVARLNAAERLPLPSLSLNRADKPGPQKAHFYQMGLIPEDEAMRLAERAAAEGKRRALALVPRNLLGQRLGAQLATQFAAAGGVLAETVYFDKGALMEGALKDGLGLADSQRRFEAIKAVTGLKPVFEARRRADIDSLFLSASPEEARQLKPLLDFHNAGNLPVYASNRLYAGEPAADRDLDGIRFPDQPWLIAHSPELDALRQDVRAALPQGLDKRLGRLFALGFDAYLLIPELHALRNQPGRRLMGLTGELELTANGWLVQHQPWARIRGGEAELLPPAAPAVTP